jgi:hypothetical protein
MDLTPLAPLLAGTRTVGVDIGTWVGDGWYVDLDLSFTADPGQASPKRPAAGAVPVFFEPGVGGTSLTPVNVTIPAGASRVVVRLFTSGHGGGDPAGDPDCIGPMDEFCRRDHRILVDGGPVWTDEIWVTCPAPCSGWNACGWTSCEYPRAGWCPGFVTCHDSVTFCDQDLDATAWLPAGASHDIGYEIPNNHGTWAVSLVLFWYR